MHFMCNQLGNSAIYICRPSDDVTHPEGNDALVDLLHNMANRDKYVLQSGLMLLRSLDITYGSMQGTKYLDITYGSMQETK